MSKRGHYLMVHQLAVGRACREISHVLLSCGLVNAPKMAVARPEDSDSSKWAALLNVDQQRARARMVELEEPKRWRQLTHAPSLWLADNFLKKSPSQPPAGGILTGDSYSGKSRIIITMPGTTLILCRLRQRFDEWKNDITELRGQHDESCTVMTYAAAAAMHRRHKATEYIGRVGSVNNNIFTKRFDRVIIDDCVLKQTAKLLDVVEALNTGARWCVGCEIWMATAKRLLPMTGLTPIEHTVAVQSSSMSHVRYLWHHVALSQSCIRNIRTSLGAQEAARYMAGHTPLEQSSIEGVNISGGDTCAVCMESCCLAKLTGCDHRPQVCMPCLRQWALENHPVTCPLCRAKGDAVTAAGIENITVAGRKATIVRRLIQGDVSFSIWGTPRYTTATLEKWGLPRMAGMTSNMPQHHVVVWDWEESLARREIGRLRRQFGTDWTVFVHTWRLDYYLP